MLLPVASRWRYDSEPVLTHGSVQGETLIKHRKVELPRIMYVGFMAISFFMAKEFRALPRPLGNDGKSPF